MRRQHTAADGCCRGGNWCVTFLRDLSRTLLDSAQNSLGSGRLGRNSHTAGQWVLVSTVYKANLAVGKLHVQVLGTS